MSRYRDLRPHEPLPPKPARKRPAKHAAPPPPPPPGPKRPDLGPRPLSARQQAHREAAFSRPGVAAAPPVPLSAPERGSRGGARAYPELPPPPSPRAAGGAAQGAQGAAHGAQGGRGKVRRVRDADTTHARVRRQGSARRVRNRKRGNLPRVLLAWASGFLAVECAAALLFSPRFLVRRVVVEGNRDVPAQAILGRLGLGDHDNIVRLRTGRLREAVLREPRVASAEIHRSLPGTVRVVVKERAPWACAQIADGTCYVIDRGLVPFRTADVPPVGLPLLKLSGATQAPPLGRPMAAPGLEQVSRCLAWANARPDFPLDAVSIDGEGKLCLNRAGGAKFLLGSGSDLDKKLHALETLLAQRADLRGATNVAYVNLYAYDAPAVFLRPANRANRAAARDAEDPSADPSPSAALASPPPSPPSATKAPQ